MTRGFSQGKAAAGPPKKHKSLVLDALRLEGSTLTCNENDP